MFNRGGFNKVEFNTTTNADVYLYGILSAESGLAAEFNASFTLSSILPGESSTTVQIYRLIEVSGSMSSDGMITATVIRVIHFDGNLPTEANINAVPLQLRKETIEFMADFEPGDVIVIDSKKKTVTLNGVNASDLAEGFMKLKPGTNDIKYEDEETSRTVGVQITHREKHLY